MAARLREVSVRLPAVLSGLRGGAGVTDAGSAPSPGHAVAAVLAAVILGTLAAVAWAAGGLSALTEWDWRALRFTLWQAALSATLSALLAVPVARALARRRFRGRGLLVTLLGAPFILPVIVAIMGLIAVFGRNGAVNEGLRAVGLPELSVYGWQGVILAHVFFNLPLSVRLILQGWQAIPAERFRLAASLDFAPRDIARHLERPMLRATLPGVWLAVFLVCLTSFTVALALGGGPRATTVELAIYQAFRFDFDLGRAATLGLMQIVLCVGALLLARWIAVPTGFGAGMDDPALPPAPGGWRRGGDALVIAAAAAFLLTPLLSVTTAGLPRLAVLPGDVWAAALRSVIMAVTSAVLAVAACLALALAIARGAGRWVEAAGMLPLVASPLVLGTGLFVLMRDFVTPQQMALPVTVAVNAAMALPFGLRALIPAAQALQADYGQLAASLDLRGFARLRLLVLPRLSRPLGFAGGLAAALAMGDLGVITLFASDQPTLPLKLYQLMNSYRMADASAAAVLLMTLSFALFWVFDRGERMDA
ncbi:MAG: thiamine/thiamine pyrophosphate ABC transporter permease ThiP [Paracoccus sp. (in: a-proteobacteria)]|uniref:thiamine/thiamine pyrophosphate ABC transporter permease ThiP n=1 Tax=Paracoccus sp. TaxID=267 RepID=UPI0040588F00